VVYDNVKKALGLDKAHTLMYGAAPLSPAIRKYFLSLNMYLISGYGKQFTFLFSLFFRKNNKNAKSYFVKSEKVCQSALDLNVLVMLLTMINTKVIFSLQQERGLMGLL